VFLGPGDVHIEYAGTLPPHDALNGRISGLCPGDPVVVEGRQIKSRDSHVMGMLASKTDLKAAGPQSGTVSGILVRTREQTSPEYLCKVRSHRWETVLVELTVPGSREA
jgi:hypothetical protein